MFDGDIDINLLAVALAKSIAENCDKPEIVKVLHLLSLLQNALRTYIL
jgi:hypothetical protein